MVIQGLNSGSSSHKVQANLTSVTDPPCYPSRRHPQRLPVRRYRWFPFPCLWCFASVVLTTCFLASLFCLRSQLPSYLGLAHPEGGLCRCQSCLLPLTRIPEYSIPGQLGGPIIKGGVIGCVRDCEKKEKDVCDEHRNCLEAGSN